MFMPNFDFDIALQIYPFNKNSQKFRTENEIIDLLYSSDSS